jgi:hypothetical protein
LRLRSLLAPVHYLKEFAKIGVIRVKLSPGFRLPLSAFPLFRFPIRAIPSHPRLKSLSPSMSWFPSFPSVKSSLSVFIHVHPWLKKCVLPRRFVKISVIRVKFFPYVSAFPPSAFQANSNSLLRLCSSAPLR